MSGQSLRGKAEQRSDAPRYIGIIEFSRITGTPSYTLRRWLRNGSEWVPNPAVLLGIRLGWEREAAEKWERGLTGFERPEPVTYLTVAQMTAKWHCAGSDLWEWVMDGKLAGPAIWLDGNPGWPA